MLHLGVHIFLKEGSRQLIDILHNLGLCASYMETKRFVCSLLRHEEPHRDLSSNFIQFAFDNADYNVKTLDGYGTFHNMGGIRCITPSPADSALPCSVRRLKGKLEIDVTRGRIPLSPYKVAQKRGLHRIDVADVGVLRMSASMKACRKIDCLWLCSFSLPKVLVKGVGTPAWSGYMEAAHSKCGPYDVSKVETVPFVMYPPTDMSCIYTTLKFAVEQCHDQGQEACVVTLDHPLWLKAMEIVESSPELKSVVVVLGAFHLMMSFLGSIGQINSGSGLEELFGTVYAKNSIPQIMSGKAYSRAMRAHSLAQSALSMIIIKDKMDGGVCLELSVIHEQLIKKSISPDEAIQNTTADTLERLLATRCSELASQNRTSKLWVDYFYQVGLVRLFTQSLRSSNWDLYKDSMRAMLPYFHAAGHLSYAKAVHLYLQKMDALESKMNPREFEFFTRRGSFTVRHTDAFFKGVPMDLTIEQKLMRFLKTCGLTRGRGLTESTLAQFIAAFPQCVPLSQRLECFTGIRQEASEQHVELRESRKLRDEKDLQTFLSWFESHPPFEERPTDMLVSLSTGMVADSTVNCDQAWDIGLKSMSAMQGSNFGNVTLKRNNKVKPLADMSNKIEVRGEHVSINPEQLLNRIICMLNANNGSLVDYLEYELSPMPPSLFDKVSLRKTDKSALAAAIAAQCAPSDCVPETGLRVVDGGMLLRAVVWPRPATYSEISEVYKKYVISHFGADATIVFDGYEQHLSTKGEEHKRRCTKATSPTLTVGPDLLAVSLQANFLANAANKTSFIKMLTPILERAGVTVLQAPGDADTLIVDTALSHAHTGSEVIVSATDTNILAMLVQKHCGNSKLYLHSPATGGKPPKVHDIGKVREALGPVSEVILFAHAVTGSDTTSALFGKGKVSIVKLLQKDDELRNSVKIFNTAEADPEALTAAGEKLLLTLYGGQRYDSLNALRYSTFHRSTAKQNLSATFHMESLPPTSAAARQHTLRVYLQVQEWLGRQLEPTEYGWRCLSDPPRLVPIASLSPAAPEHLLKLICCGCKSGCRTNACACKQGGLPCSGMCSNCEGLECENGAKPNVEEEDSDPDDPQSQW